MPTVSCAPPEGLMSHAWKWSLAPASPTEFAARNLYELFVHDLSTLVTGSQEAERAGHGLYRHLPSEEIALRELALGLAAAGRAAPSTLANALAEEGIDLRSIQDPTVSAVFYAVQPSACGTEVQPWSVAGMRLLDLLEILALNLKTRALHAAENARLLGSDGLHTALMRCAAGWRCYDYQIRSHAPGFRARAYASGLVDWPCRRQIA
ncbi:MAG: hypothetical protein ABIQ12_04000 [Opitutaceae bacterium]